VVIVESFSKSIGLSGQRIGFVHSSNADLMHQLAIRLMYSSNGVNAFAQVLVEKLLTTKEGQQAITDFKNQTTRDIRLNINYLMNRGLLANSFYKNSQPKGIFVVVNRSFDELLAHRIASVSLSFFTKKHSDIAKQYARICVSVPHDTFVRFFNQIEL
jgi:aspartate/methionine/tyrosine aminotransferase